MDKLLVTRQEAQWQSVRRGTLQHEILEGSQAAVYDDGETIQVQVNCAAYAGRLDEPVPYALAATLEIAPELGIDIYTEVEQRIQMIVPVRPRG